MQDLTVAYFTSRKEPKIAWFLDSLKAQLNGRKLGQLIIVDYYAEMPGRDEPLKLDLSFCDHIDVTPPKPCVMQGKHRQTKKEYFAASNARNTAFALCRHNYIACVDDLSVLMPGWLDNVQHAKDNKYIVCGAYKKVMRLAVNEKGIAEYDAFPPGVDSRLYRGSSKGIVPWSGRDFFGCSFGLPIEAALQVNGFDECCDFQGAEDYDFGMRLERAGNKIFYNINMMTLESEELHHVEGNAKFIRESKQSYWNGQKMGSDWVMLNRVSSETNRFTTISDHYSLRDLRQKMLHGGTFPPALNPRHDWRDGTPLCEM